VLTVIIALLAGTGIGTLAGTLLGSNGWGITLGVVGFVLAAIPLNLWMKKRLEALFIDVQSKVEGTQDKLRRKITMMQTKMVSGGKGLQRRMEKEQAQGIRDALKTLDQVKRLQKWNFLAERQANTIRAQLCYQIKDFENADRYFKKCLVMDPLTLAMKMARLYKLSGAEAVEKPFRKGIKRFKDEQATILYALYSWVLVKENRVSDAVALLNDAKDKTEDETLRLNWEHLANNRVRRFSNAGLGDQWYALHLETPKPVKMRQRMGKRLR